MAEQRRKDYRVSNKNEKTSRNNSVSKKEIKIWDGKCPYFKVCGGCDYIDKPYEEQLALKQKQMSELLKDVLKKDEVNLSAIVGAENPLYYRNKVHSVFARSKGEVIRGIYMENSHDVVDVRGCLLEDKLADSIIESIRQLVPSFKYQIYNEDTGRGWLRHVLVRIGHRKIREDSDRLSQDVMVVLVTSEVMFAGKNNFVKALRERHPQITTIIQNINDKRTSMVLGERNITVYGKGFIEDDSLGLRFRISPSAFFQINTEQTRKLYSIALDMAGLTGKENVLDAYCGTGTIGMFMSGKARSVTGVELNSQAVKDAVSNAKANKISNIRFIAEDATQYMQSIVGSDTKYDVLCLDPPRSGTTPEFIAVAAALDIPRIVYVSCGPDTLARDLKLFQKSGYKLLRAVPVDMFPQTEHCEMVCLLFKNHY